MAKRRTSRSVEVLVHDAATRKNIPTAEHEPVMAQDDRSPVEVAYERRNRDLDPQLVWRGKDEQNWSDLVVQAPPLFIQEKVHPKALINDLLRHSKTAEAERLARESGFQVDLFADFNGLPSEDARTEFYQHDANWSNRMILGDSLQVMASLAEREGLRGKVQCIYLDPPYGIKFNSNFQWSTTSRDVKDGKAEHISREPEQVKAFRDTWRDGIHSYLTYLRDRLTVARDLLSESGSIFVQIGDENVHRVRALMDEIFGAENLVSQINFKSMGALGQGDIPNVYDYLIWYARSKGAMKFRSVYRIQNFDDDVEYKFVADAHEPLGFRTLRQGEERPEDNSGLFRRSTLTSSGYTPSCTFEFRFHGRIFRPFGRKSWRTNFDGMERLSKGGRFFSLGNNLYFFVDLRSDAQLIQYENSWTDAPAAADKFYVVQTASKGCRTLHAHDHRSGRPRPRSNLRFRHHRLRRRTVGPALDHHRYIPSSTRTRPRPHHGCALPILPARRQPRRAAERSRDCRLDSARHPYPRKRSTRLRLRTRSPHHAQIDRKQRRTRRHLGTMAGDAGAAPRRAE